MKWELSKKSIFILAALCFSQQAGAQQRSATESNEMLRGAIAGAILSQALKNTVSRNVENLDFKTAVTIQQALSFLGHYNGKFDGIIGAQSSIAISRFQSSIGNPPTGVLTEKDFLLLIGQYSTALAKEPDPLRSIARLAARPSPKPARTAPNAAPSELQTASYSSSEIYASRLFAGPGDYPPGEFAAYGILAFKSRASPHDRARQVMICEAYVNSIRPFQQIGKPTSEQMVTIWPIQTRQIADMITSLPENAVCEKAIQHYGSLTADRALRHADAAGAELTGLGPYLLAWSPPKKKGEPDAIVLVADLSDVTDYTSALDVMLNWVQDIERDPQLWSNGWTLEALRAKAQKWFDRRGTQLLVVFGG